ncbi:AAA family ATPase [Vibrio tapetis]|uniref:Putative DNA repair ATPase protein n=1 Tax=Vibrio tapetis subsp. tapetis TaxID=1671868 RepID=A0A2N8Z9G1_9VIBR|nr:AAA family ATPase [Vibrio tapetis]SON48536.1 putative DNA repair ATPase protein [Vibrio tapetis subsp. tapetis]
MKLIKIIIKNFRQFYGEQEINFSTDSERKITLFHGENNGGKTTLLNAIRWCLFQEFTSNFHEKTNLVNETASLNGVSGFKVVLTLENNGVEYIIQRISESGSKKGQLSVYIINRGVKEFQSNPQFIINTIIPSDMAPFFFYQGEGDGGLTNENNFSYIKQSIKRILGFEVAEKALKDLDSVLKVYNRNLAELDTTGVLEDLYFRQQQMSVKVDRNKNQINNLLSSISRREERLENAIQRLINSNVDYVQQQAKILNGLEESLKYIDSELVSLSSEKNEKLSSSWALSSFTSKLRRFTIGSIDTSELDLSHQFSVNKDLLRHILDINQCICNSDLDKSISKRDAIESLLGSAIDLKLKARWKRVINLYDSLDNKPNLALKAMIELTRKQDQLLENKHKKQREIEEIEATIKSSKVDASEAKLLQADREQLKLKLESDRNKLRNIEPLLKQEEAQLRSIKNEIATHEGSVPQAENLKNIVSATKKIIKLIESNLSDAEKGSDSIVLKKMQDFFSRVAFNENTVKSINGSFRIVNKHGIPQGVGGGYQTMLSVSFIVSLIQYSKDRSNSKNYLLTPGTVAPFMADAILSEISLDHGREILGYITECVDQFILLLSQTQWREDSSDTLIREHIGREYNFVQNVMMSEKEWKGTYPTKLKVRNGEYDVVRFNSSFVGTTIEEVQYV